MYIIGSLVSLNDARENSKLLAELPDWLLVRWGKKVSIYQGACGSYSFNFVDFVVFGESDIVCNPVESI